MRFFCSGRRARYRGDSGSSRSRRNATTNGTNPPTANMPRHPNVGSARSAKMPESMPPSGMHTIVNVIANGRYRRGTNSEDSAAAFGSAPAQPDADEKPNQSKRRDAVDLRRRERHRAKGEHAADQRETTTEAVARRRRLRRRSSCRRSRARRRSQRPAVGTDHSSMIDGMARPSNLIVDAVKNDRERGKADDEFLETAAMHLHRAPGRCRSRRSGHQPCPISGPRQHVGDSVNADSRTRRWKVLLNNSAWPSACARGVVCGNLCARDRVSGRSQTPKSVATKARKGENTTKRKSA